jgi:hypothetical protein
MTWIGVEAVITPALDLQTAPHLIEGAKTQSAQASGGDGSGGFSTAFNDNLSAAPLAIPLKNQIVSEGSAMRTQAGVESTSGATLVASKTFVGRTVVLGNKQTVGRNQVLVQVVQGKGTSGSNVRVEISAPTGTSLSAESSGKVGKESGGSDASLRGASSASAKIPVVKAVSADPAETELVDSRAVLVAELKASPTTLNAHDSIRAGISLTAGDASSAKGIMIASKPSVEPGKSKFSVQSGTQTSVSHVSQGMSENSSIAPSAAAPALEVSLVLPTEAAVGFALPLPSLPKASAEASLQSVSSASLHTGASGSQIVTAWNSVEGTLGPAAADVSQSAREASTPLRSRAISEQTASKSAGEKLPLTQAGVAIADNSLSQVTPSTGHSYDIAVPTSYAAQSEVAINKDSSHQISTPLVKAEGNSEISGLFLRTATQVSEQSGTSSALTLQTTSTPQTAAARPTARAVTSPEQLRETSPARPVSPETVALGEPVSGLRYAIDNITRAPAPLAATNGTHSVPLLPSAQTASSTANAPVAAIQNTAGAPLQGHFAGTEGNVPQLHRGPISNPSVSSSSKGDSAPTGTAPHVLSSTIDAPGATSHSVIVSTADAPPITTASILPPVLSGHMPLPMAAPGALTGVGGPVTSALQATAVDGTHGTGSMSAVAGTQPHQTLAVTPNSLEVGVQNGTQGWLKIRAEIGEQGDVKASLATASPVTEQMLKGQMPALNAYLHSEQMSITATIAERIGGGHVASTHDASLGSAATSTGSNGQDSSMFQRGEQSTFADSSREGIASNPSTTPSVAVIDRAGTLEAKDNRPGGSASSQRSTESSGSGRWLNVTV